MKYYLVTGQTPAQAAVPAREFTPARTIDTPTGTMHYPEVTAQEAVPAVPSQDIRILIGESNPFDTSGKPFKPATHKDFGITTVDAWKRLIIVYGQRFTHEYIVTPEGLRQDRNSEVIPAIHLFGLLNDGFVKEGKTENGVEKVIYWKQKGRIEDDLGKTYTAEEMLKILEDK